MKIKSLIELTPLLDVFLILIFAFLVSYRTRSQSEQAAAKASVDSLQQIIKNLETKLEIYSSNLDSAELKSVRLLNQLREQQQMFQEAMISLSEDMADFFADSRLNALAMKEKGELSTEDFEKFLEGIEQIVPENKKEFIRKVYILKELDAFSSVLDVYVNDQNELLIQGKPTGLTLNDFDEKLDDFPKTSRERFEQKTRELLEQAFQNGLRGKEKFGDILLITLGHSGQTLQGVIALTKKCVSEFYRQIQRSEAGNRKILYSEIGYYPF